MLKKSKKMKTFYILTDSNGYTVPLHSPAETMKFYDRESAEMMLKFFRRLGHAMKDFYIEEQSGRKQK